MNRRILDMISTDTLRKLQRELYTLMLDNDMKGEWDRELYQAYETVNNIMDDRYTESHMDQYREFYEKNIKGRTVGELDSDTYSFWSDFHKDMFGHRPRPARGEIL